jgi:II/X family phage/plasmid replication protein
MVDFLSVEIPCDLPGPIRGGSMVKLTRDGEVEWETSTRLMVEGSWDARCSIRAVSLETLEISGNVTKFLQGHNLYGPADPIQLLRLFLDRVQPLLWPEGMPPIDVEAASISRIDCTSNLLLATPGDVLSFIRAAEQRGNCSHRGRGVLKGEGTLVYGDATGKRAKAWQLTFYSKGLEVAKHPLPAPMMEREDVLEWVNRLLRVEVRVRTPELKRLGLRMVADWGPGSVEAVWREKLARIDLMEGAVMACSEFEGVPARLLDTYDAWCAGRDLRVGRSRASWYRVRKQMKETFGVDVSIAPPKTNVVPLRRIVVAEPACRPRWADDIDRLLQAA